MSEDATVTALKLFYRAAKREKDLGEELHDAQRVCAMNYADWVTVTTRRPNELRAPKATVDEATTKWRTAEEQVTKLRYEWYRAFEKLYSAHKDMERLQAFIANENEG